VNKLPVISIRINAMYIVHTAISAARSSIKDGAAVGYPGGRFLIHGAVTGEIAEISPVRAHDSQRKYRRSSLSQ
jgi:hypothetical protein